MAILLICYGHDKIMIFTRPFQTSIKNKLVALMIVCISVPLILISFISFYNSTNSMENEIVNSNDKKIIWAGKYVDKTIKQFDDVLFTFLIDNNLVSSAGMLDDEDANTRFVSNKYIMNKMSSIFYSNNDFVSLTCLFTFNRKLFNVSNEKTSILSDYIYENSDWYNIALEAQKTPIISNKKTDKKLDRDSGTKGYSESFLLMRCLKRFEDRSILGVTVLEIKWDVFRDITEMLNDQKESRVFMLDREGKLVYNPNKYDLDNGYIENINMSIRCNRNEKSYIKTKTDYIFFKMDSTKTITIVKVIPFDVIGGNSRKTLGFSLLLGALFILGAIALSVLVAYSTTKPIIRLAHSMKQVEYKKFDIPIENKRSDEIGILEKSYIIMMNEIKNHIDTEYKSKIEKRTAQLKALQAQINPHFLNNTLQLIGSIAVSRNIPEIYSIIMAISDMFRYTVKKKEDIVSLEQEINHVRNYLLIQTLRYKGNLETEIYFDEGLQNCTMPKLILQPIVENSFIHGLEHKIGLWKVSLKAMKTNGDIEVTVEDNGMGIDEQKLEELNNQLESNLNDIFSSDESIGLKNVDARLKLSYGMNYGIRLYSEKSVGTRVLLKFPAVCDLGENDDKADYRG